jgi:hypothetical protein
MHIFAHIQSLDYFSLVICHNNILLFNKALKNSILIQMKILKKCIYYCEYIRPYEML